MESHIHQIEFFWTDWIVINYHIQDVCYHIIGIWGIGGMGKTTLIDIIFHRNSFEFDGCLFLTNVREESENHGLNCLRNEFFCELLREKCIL